MTCSCVNNKRTNITWTTSTSLMTLSSIPLTRVWITESLSDEDQFKPFLTQEVSRRGAPDRNSGVAAYSVPRGSVM